MRNRIAVWGRDAQENRVLITVELQAADNIVRIETYPEKVVTDEVYKLFMDKWRKAEDAELPEADRTIARELSVTEGLLPDDLKAEQTDMILRAQTEWHFHVLSEKLAQTYRGELAEIEDRIERASEYSSDLWNQARDFWQKVQGQVQDKTLLREQGNDIRKRVDKTFATLKAMREKLNEQYQEESTKQVARFSEMLEGAEKKIEEGTHLKKVFGELRDIQKKFHNVKFTKKDRDAVYKRIDAAFKAVKAKRGQGGGNDGAAGGGSRHESRLQGLLKAMERMQSSLGRDKKDLEFEQRRIERTDGQLEKQIRQAKVVMIESRMVSKQNKLTDMEKTKAMLEKKIVAEKQKEEKRAKKAAERAAADAAKAKIAAEIAGREVSPEEAAKLEAAAAAIQAGKAKKGGRKKASERVPDQIANLVAISEIVTGDVPATSERAVEVTTPEAEENLGKTILDKAGDIAVDAIESVGKATEGLRKEGGLLDKAQDTLEAVADQIEDVVEDATTTAKAVAQVASKKIAQATGEEE